MNNLLKNIFYVIAFFIIISMIFSVFSSLDTEQKDISLSQLTSKINAGEVSKIEVTGDNLKITSKDGTIYSSQKETNSSLIETLTNLGINSEQLQSIEISFNNESFMNSIWMVLLIQLVLPMVLIFGLFWFISRQTQKGLTQTLNFSKSNARLFSSNKEKVTFNDVAGSKEAKEELKEVVDFLKNPQKFLDIGARIPRGVLLVGAPGTGKTLLARAVAGEANVPFFHISGSEFVELFVGVGASRVRDLFSTAKKVAPAIVFIDEIDAVGGQRGTGLGGGHDEREQTLNQILVEMDGFDRDTNIIVIAATNRPDVLDPALLRPGRFDRRIILDLPDINERKEILKIHLRGKKISQEVELEEISQRTPGFSGADLANLVNEAAILAARNNKKIIEQNDFFQAMEKVVLGPERKSHVLTQKEREITAYHEAGHALVAAFSPNSDPVHKVSIVARGRAAGYTLKLPIEDTHLYSKAKFLDELNVALGGYVAEKIIFKDITTGASNDLKQATEIARDLVTKYGMSEKIGPVSLSEDEEILFLGRDLFNEKKYSEKMAQEIDEEIRKLIINAENNAFKIINSNKKLLDEIAKKLMTNETIERKEFEEIISSYKKEIKQTKNNKRP
jgi:cell division protease FtsH